MTYAITGAAVSITTGSATAEPAIQRVDKGGTCTEGDDKSSTGNSVQLDIDQIPLISTPQRVAGISGNNIVDQNATATNRRSRCAGHAMSATVLRLGRDTRRTTAIGTDTNANESRQ
jgi:hypothetical protein